MSLSQTYRIFRFVNFEGKLNIFNLRFFNQLLIYLFYLFDDPTLFKMKCLQCNLSIINLIFADQHKISRA